jgi:cytochrome c oxidase subunit 3
MRVTPFTDPNARRLAGRLGMKLFLVSIGIIFAATMLAHAVARFLTQAWPQDLPPLPHTLWISTAVLIVSSFTMQLAVHAARMGYPRQLRVMMLLTTYLGIAFLVLQTRCWMVWLSTVMGRWDQSIGYANGYRYALTSFYVLTGLHALHVIGGLIPMAVITRNAFRGYYSVDRYTGVELVAMYWHFLDAVWLVLFAMLAITK